MAEDYSTTGWKNILLPGVLLATSICISPCCRRIFIDGTKIEVNYSERRKGEKMFKIVDPVCGHNIDLEEARGIIRFNGRLHYFCCRECRKKFIKSPGKYLENLESLMS